jgi:hypothetical protein
MEGDKRMTHLLSINIIAFESLNQEGAISSERKIAFSNKVLEAVTSMAKAEGFDVEDLCCDLTTAYSPKVLGYFQEGRN